MLTPIDNHSVDLSLLPARATVLDVGCRGFRFAEHFAALGHRVVAMDPGEERPTFKEHWELISFLQSALVPDGMDGVGKLVLTADPEARHVVPWHVKVDHAPWQSVGCLSLTKVMRLCNVEEFDLAKFNMEGGEFDILDRLHAPVLKQIVVSFHEHTSRRRGEAAVNGLVQRLGKWYDVVRHEWDERYCAGRNAWDTVLVRR